MNAILEEVREKLNRLTPLKTDCGRLCGARCCASMEGEETGMLLFPGEEDCYEDAEGWRIVPAGKELLLICPGKCGRDERPLSCRVFPFFPVPDETGSVSAAPDSRGAGLCPLLRQIDCVAFDRRFLRRVKTAGRFLARDETLRTFLDENAAEIAETSAFLNRLTK